MEGTRILPERRPDQGRIHMNIMKTSRDQASFDKLRRINERYEKRIYNDRLPKWWRGMNKTYQRQMFRNYRMLFDRIDRDYEFIYSSNGRIELKLIMTAENDPLNQPIF